MDDIFDNMRRDLADHEKDLSGLEISARGADPESSIIAHAIIALARAVNLQTVAMLRIVAHKGAGE